MTLSGFNWNSGKAAMMGSFMSYLQTQINDEFFDFDNPILPVKLPGYGVTEKGLYNMGVTAFDEFLGYRYAYSGYSGYSGVSGESGYSAWFSGWSGRVPAYGRKNQTLVEISAWDDESVHSNAVGKIRQMRDKIVYLLYNAGRVDDDGHLILPAMKIYDYGMTPAREVGVIEVDPADNAINEKQLIDPINQNIKVYRILVRLFWYEYM